MKINLSLTWHVKWEEKEKNMKKEGGGGGGKGRQEKVVLPSIELGTLKA